MFEPETWHPTAGSPSSRPIELALDECLARLRSAGLGRIGISVGALPAIVPVNYGLIDEGIVFRTAAGSKLTAAAAGHVVAFEVDAADEASGVAWSVLVVGQACEVTDPDLLARAAAVDVTSWMPGERDHVVLIRTEHVTGRLLLRAR